MKKFAQLFIASVFCLISIPSVHSQIVKPLTLSKATISTSSSADTSTVIVTADDNVKSFSVTVNKTSGTPAGKFFLSGLQGDGVNWTTLDSLVLVNQPANVKTFDPGKLVYGTYRLQLLVSGTMALGIKASYLSRSR